MTWRRLDGVETRFQDGDYVRINVPVGPYSLPFVSGYVRGFTVSDDGTRQLVAYELFKMGHPRIRWVKEEILDLATAPYGPGHEKTHVPGRECPLCGAWEG